jgi:hypothetical protein
VGISVVPRIVGVARLVPDDLVRQERPDLVEIAATACDSQLADGPFLAID